MRRIADPLDVQPEAAAHLVLALLRKPLLQALPAEAFAAAGARGVRLCNLVAHMALQLPVVLWRVDVLHCCSM
jgi:hypothetical protein